jgi:hypothetical protein
MTLLTRWEPLREFSNMQDRISRMNRYVTQQIRRGESGIPRSSRNWSNELSQRSHPLTGGSRRHSPCSVRRSDSCNVESLMPKRYRSRLAQRLEQWTHNSADGLHAIVLPFQQPFCFYHLQKSTDVFTNQTASTVILYSPFFRSPKGYYLCKTFPLFPGKPSRTGHGRGIRRAIVSFNRACRQARPGSGSAPHPTIHPDPTLFSRGRAMYLHIYSFRLTKKQALAQLAEAQGDGPKLNWGYIRSNRRDLMSAYAKVHPNHPSIAVSRRRKAAK